MANYAVVQIAGKQYKVKEGDELIVDRLRQGDGPLALDKVLLVVQDSSVQVGTPNVAGTTVTAKILGHQKGEKITILRYRAKSRYRRKIGFRASQTKVLIEKIGGKTESKGELAKKSHAVKTEPKSTSRKRSE